MVRTVKIELIKLENAFKVALQAICAQYKNTKEIEFKTYIFKRIAKELVEKHGQLYLDSVLLELKQKKE